MRERSPWLRLWYLWAIPGVIVILNAVWLLGLRSAILGRGSLLARQRTLVESDVSTLDAQHNKLARAEEALAELQTSLKTLRQDELGSMRRRLVRFLVDVVRRAETAGLGPERVSYSLTPDPKSGLAHFTAAYSVSGTYEQIRRCVKELESSPEFILVERMALRGEENASSLNVAVQLTVGTYFADMDAGLIKDLGIVELPEDLLAEVSAPPALAPALQPPGRLIAAPASVPAAATAQRGGLPGSLAPPVPPGFVRPPAYVQPMIERPRPEPPEQQGGQEFMENMGEQEVSGGEEY